MGDVIKGNFPNYHIMTLDEARMFLGHNYFKKALLNCSIEVLEKYANHPEAMMSGAAEAYETILKFRMTYDQNQELAQEKAKELENRPLAQVIPFRKRAA